MPGDTEKSRSSPAELRAALVADFPEIDELCSDSYLEAVLSVPNRKFEYARDEKIRKSLEWRRNFGVERLCARFKYDHEKSVLIPLPAAEGCGREFEPSPKLLKLCESRSLRILPTSGADGRIALYAETKLCDWNAAGVEAGLQYHVLMIETALNLIRTSSGRRPESLILLVDATAPLFARPPPISALQGLASLLQTAYPDRIHNIFVGPVNFVLRNLYKLISPFISKNSQKKIKLQGTRPTLDVKGEVLSSDAASNNLTTEVQQGPNELTAFEATGDNDAVKSQDESKRCTAEDLVSAGCSQDQDETEEWHGKEAVQQKDPHAASGSGSVLGVSFDDAKSQDSEEHFGATPVNGYVAPHAKGTSSKR